MSVSIPTAVRSLFISLMTSERGSRHPGLSPSDAFLATDRGPQWMDQSRLSATARLRRHLVTNGAPPITRTILPTYRAYYPGVSGGCACRLLPHACSLSQLAGGSASALSLSRPAHHELHPPCVRRGMSRSRSVPQLARRAALARFVTDRACARSPAPFLQMKNPVKKPAIIHASCQPLVRCQNDRALVNRSG